MTPCLFCLELAALLQLNEQQFYLFGQIQTSQTGHTVILTLQLVFSGISLHLQWHGNKTNLTCFVK